VAGALSAIPGIVHQYMDQQLKEAVREQTYQKWNSRRSLSKRWKEIEVLTRSSHSSRTSYAVAADLSEMELKKILIDKMEGNKEDMRKTMIKKDPPLDQTKGLRDEEKEGSMHEPALHLNQLLGVQAGLLQGLNLDSCLPMSLLLQRNLCRLPVRWRNPHIRCLKQVQKINPLFKLLSILNSFPSKETTNTGS
nr:hypothetical protein [Tanacetum cinerariifolium]